MSHDVYICYDDVDKEIAEDVYSALKSRRLKCWMKSHDVRHDMVKEMMDAINQSHVMVLIHSEDAKESNYVNTEVDMAFSKKIPIMVFKVDDSKIDGALEFFLRPQPKFDAFKNPDDEFKRLIETTYDLVREGRRRSFWDIIKEHRNSIIISVVIILIAAVGIFMFVPLDDMNGGGSTVNLNASNITLKVTDFHVEDVTKKGYEWNYSYFVGGTISPVIGKGTGCVITSDFYDKSGNLINTTETPVDELQIIDDGFLLGSTVSDTNDVGWVDVQLIDSNNIVLAQTDSQLKKGK